jgi:hypothetical protein
MRILPILGVTMLACTVAGAAEPAPETSAASPSATASTTAPDPGSYRGQEPAPTEARKRLDLRIRDIREYLTVEEYRALLNGAEADRNTVIVQATAPLLPMKSELDVPGGIVAPFWALANPHKAWRLFLPDPRIDIRKIPPPESPIPPPVFRWGP